MEVVFLHNSTFKYCADYQSYGSGEYTIEKPEDNSTSLLMMCKHPPSQPFHIFIIFSFVVGFAIPFCVITVCYVMILVRLAQSSETARTRSKQVGNVVQIFFVLFDQYFKNMSKYRPLGIRLIYLWYRSIS